MRTGAGPDVICVHGNPSWGYLYRKVATRLQDRFRVTMPDLVGLGLSDKPRDPSVHTVPNHATWLTRGIELAGTGAFILVVQDWGGPMGLQMAKNLGDRLAGVVVLNTILAPPRQGFRPTAFHRFSRLPLVSDLVFRGFGFPQTAMWAAQGDRASIDADAAFAYRWPLRNIRDNMAPLALARLVPDSQTHPTIVDLQGVADFVATLTVPTAIVWGDRDPVLGRAFKTIHAQLPNARVWRTQGGHFLQEDAPDEIAEAVAWVAAEAGMRV